MSKGMIGAILTIFLLFIIYLGFNIKSAYKILPMNISSEEKKISFDDWILFTPSSGKFQVSLPFTPQYVREWIEIPKTDKKKLYEMYALEQMNGTIYMVGLMTYPEDTKIVNPINHLNEVIEEMKISNPLNKLESRDESHFGGYPAVNFHLKNRETDVIGRTWLIDRTVYILTYVAEQKNVDSNTVAHFFDSFSLRGAPAAFLKFKTFGPARII